VSLLRGNALWTWFSQRFRDYLQTATHYTACHAAANCQTKTECKQNQARYCECFEILSRGFDRVAAVDAHDKIENCQFTGCF
jgi:hypothetical protein